MDILDYAETAGDRSIEVARKAYDMLHERIYKTATALTAGAGAAGAFALGKIGLAGAGIQWVPLVALAVCWSAIAGFLILRGGTSNNVSPGIGAGNLREYYGHCMAEPAEDGVDWEARALRETREAEVAAKQRRLETYIDACDKRADALDLTFRLIAGSPIVAGLAALVTLACRAT